MGSKVKRLIHFLMQAALMTVKLERLIVFIYGTIYTLYNSLFSNSSLVIGSNSP